MASSLILLGTVFLMTGPGAYAAQQLPNVPGPLTGPVLPAPPSVPASASTGPSSSISGGLTGTLPAPAPVPATGWVSVGADTPLWLDAAGTIPLGIAPAGTTLQQLGQGNGGPAPVQDPYTGVRVYAVLTAPTAIQAPAQLAVPGRWWGKIGIDGANIRSAPTLHASSIGTLPLGTPVVVSAWVAGDEASADNPTWARLSDGAYVHSSLLRPVALPTMPAMPAQGAALTGHWIDVNLTQQTVVAYDGQTPVYMARTSSGRPGWETVPGNFSIGRRVASETMSSSTLPVSREMASYHLDNVRWTQYFSADGKALHENYWKPVDQIGVPSSHGCLGLASNDAKWFWDFATVGTPLIIHN
jgi:hypothetical protein